jgi:hypothetical protein
MLLRLWRSVQKLLLLPVKMPNIKPMAIRCFLLVVLAFIPFWLPAQNLPDIIVFNRGDSVGAAGGYYDSSFAAVTPPSTMTVSGPGHDKMIILSNVFYTGIQGGLIQWKSAPGGNWTLFVASPGWVTRNANGYSNVIFYLNGPNAILATNLPRVALESSMNKKTALVRLSSYLPGGLDGDTNTWQLVSIPLTDFQPYNGFALSQFKDVNFNQDLADAVTNTLWLDGVRIVVPGSSNNPPSAPLAVVTRAGDQSVVLHWDRSLDADVAGYNVYRSAATNGTFASATANPLVNLSFADLNVTNGQTYFYVVRAVNSNGQESTNSAIVSASPQSFANDDDFLEYLQHTTFDFFWYEANPTNGLVRDRSQPASVVSIAGVGFGLTGIGIAIDHGWITRAQGRQRVLTTLRTFRDGPQGAGASGLMGYKGWFYHVLGLNSATRDGTSELSSIDTGLLLAGMLYVKQYFDANQSEENEIRSAAAAVFNRVDWQWMANGGNSLTLGWTPETGFLPWRWIGYSEAMVLYIMGLGASTNPLPSVHWSSWTSGYAWRTNYGYAYVEFPPLFGHQFSHCWVDFRHIADAYMRVKASTYFENSRRATLAQQQYCIANPQQFGYTSNVWGLTACDGPGFGSFKGYTARGAPPGQNDDGTLAPTAVGGSLPFAPEVCVPTLRNLYDRFRTNIWTGYGFRDAFNFSANWWDVDVLSIDEGAILLMAENYRSQKVWRVFAQNPEIQRGLAAAGFTGLPSVSLSLAHTPGNFMLSWPATIGLSYQVEYSPDLLTWAASPGFVRATNTGTLNWIDIGPPATVSAPATAPMRFYRVFQL